MRLLHTFNNHDSALCVKQQRVQLGSPLSQRDGVCSISMDLDTALTTFSFESRDGSNWQLDSEPEGLDRLATVALNGTQWRLKAADGRHFKIFSDDGNLYEVCLHMQYFFICMIKVGKYLLLHGAENYCQKARFAIYYKIIYFNNLLYVYFFCLFVEGKFLSSEMQWANKKKDWFVVCLGKENHSNDQLWKISPSCSGKK